MDPIKWENRPQLREPVLVCAFDGWNDAAEAASIALSFLKRQSDAQQIATIDPEEFFDFQVTRPNVRLTDGRTRSIEWPELSLSTVTPPGCDHDLVLLYGHEPNLRWRSFCETVVEITSELDIDTVVTMGALLADVPHTRPVPITGIGSDDEMVELLGSSETSYEGPTGIVGVLHDFCAKNGLRTASLWAAVPHYVATVSSPKAALALIGQLETLLETRLDTEELETAVTAYQQRLDEAVAQEPEIRQLVEQLEEQIDEQDVSFTDLPTGDSIAREFQRYLKDRDDL